MVISDTSVLIVNALLLVSLILFPLFQTIAQTVQQQQIDSLETTISRKDYSVLLSSLFGRVKQDVPNDAYTYIKDMDEYRVRVARNVEENSELIAAIDRIIQNYPKRLAEGFSEEVVEIEEEVQELKNDMYPYIDSDAFLSEAVTGEYDLYVSVIERLIRRANAELTVDNLNDIRTDSYELRRKIALLYSRVRGVMRQEA